MGSQSRALLGNSEGFGRRRPPLSAPVRARAIFQPDRLSKIFLISHGCLVAYERPLAPDTVAKVANRMAKQNRAKVDF